MSLLPPLRYLGEDLEAEDVARRLRQEGVGSTSLFVVCACPHERRQLLIDFLRQAELTDCFGTHDGRVQVRVPRSYLEDDELSPLLERLRGYRAEVISVVGNG